ncbi:MAG TPA: YbgC/FadM family acyl-CoA thioesterase [Campylobacterales bacterium]|nr:YbgC/FadM family acyl-CoA thioesterase [Campylobacterales bacterium]HHS91856.1 YbgC/FadM family acyl-CoA thioesterase [Campylobacterales bacterium]
MQIRVYYEDTDAGGIVYHTNFIKYCERARSELFFAKEILPMSEDGAGFVVRHIDANFLGMAKLGDLIDVKTQLLSRKKASVVLQQTIFKQSTKIFQMEVTLAYISGGKPSRIPDDFLAILS